MKMLGVTVGNDFSVSQHVQRLVTSSAQARYALRVTTPLCSTCSGLPSSPVWPYVRCQRVATDRQRINSVL